MVTPMSKAWLLLALLLSMSLWGTPTAAQELTVGLRSEFYIDPHYLFLGPNMAAARHLYEALVDRDADARPQPGLAESWKMVDDKIWEFKLRRGVVFHDGGNFTAADVVFSIERVPSLANNPGPYTPNLRTIVRTEAVDDYTIRFHTDRPNPVLPGQLTNIFILSAKAAAGAVPADFASGKAAIGTGPFRLVSYSRGERMVVERNERYWGPKPPWQRVTFKVMTNNSSRLAALLSGDVDLIEELPPSDAVELRKSGKVSIFRRVSDRVMYLLPNVGAEMLPLLTDADGAPLAGNPLRDLRVRQAISKAIDRQLLVDRALDGQAVPAGQIVPAEFSAPGTALAAEKSDPAGAQRLLAEAGLPKGFGLTLACTNDRYVNDARVCQSIGQMLTRAGIKSKVAALPGSVFFPKIRVTKSEMPLILYGTSSSSTRDAAHALSLVLHSYDPEQDFGQSNRGNFRDAGLDKMIESAIFTVGEKREPMLHAAMAEGMRQLSAIPLYNQMTIAAARKGIVYSPRMDEQLVATGARPE
jgi:peptide/nickel transport system substrate-binding protein